MDPVFVLEFQFQKCALQLCYFVIFVQDVFSCEWCEKKYGLKKNLLRHICSSHIEEDVNMATKATTCKATAYKVCNRYIRTNVSYLFFFP